MPKMIVPVEEIEEGDFLPGLEMGYVFDIDTDPDLRGDYNVNIADGMYLISFHDTSGDENYLLLYPGVMVEVQRD